MESRGSIRSDIPQTRQRNRYSVCIPASFRQLLTSGRRDSYNRRNSDVQDINLSGFQLAAIPAKIKEEKIDEENKKSKRFVTFLKKLFVYLKIKLLILTL